MYGTKPPNPAMLMKEQEKKDASAPRAKQINFLYRLHSPQCHARLAPSFTVGTMPKMTSNLKKYPTTGT